ncbi:MAG: cation transporter, partial [Oscillospiraceae bacterium]|nr:cation transporter [Oscillospiraceae bacterium]
AFSSLISLIAVRFSALPLSDRHRYGYGKAESLSAFLQAAFIIGSGFFVLCGNRT